MTRAVNVHLCEKSAVHQRQREMSYDTEIKARGGLLNIRAATFYFIEVADRGVKGTTTFPSVNA